MLTGVVLLILGLIKKKKLKGGIVLAVSVLLFFISFMMPAPEGSKEKVEVASKTEEELNKEKAASEVKKEEENIVKEEEQRKAKEAEDKALAEKKAKEEAVLKEEQASKDKKEEEKSKVVEQPKEKTKPVSEPQKPLYVTEGEKNAELYPAKPGAMLYDKTSSKFKGMNYYLKGELVGVKKLEGLFGNMEDALLIKNEHGYVMPVFTPHEIDASNGDILEFWGPLSGDGYAASDLGVNNVVGMTGAMNAIEIGAH